MMGSPKKKGKEVSCFFKDGFKCQTADKQFKYQFGGRIQFDYATATGGDDVVNALGDPDALGDGTELRRARLFLKGTVYDTVNFEFQVDFAEQVSDPVAGEVAFKDMYLEFFNLPYIDQWGKDPGWSL